MKKKTLTIAIALVLVVALAVGATWAYLTAQSGPVTNTFTAGTVIAQGGFELKEHEVVYDNATGLYAFKGRYGRDRWQHLRSTGSDDDRAEGSVCNNSARRSNLRPTCS